MLLLSLNCPNTNPSLIALFLPSDQLFVMLKTSGNTLALLLERIQCW